MHPIIVLLTLLKLPNEISKMFFFNSREVDESKDVWTVWNIDRNDLKKNRYCTDLT